MKALGYTGRTGADPVFRKGPIGRFLEPLDEGGAEDHGAVRVSLVSFRSAELDCATPRLGLIRSLISPKAGVVV
ncbi:MAG: hypothetical protein WBO74_14735 [Thermoanaerobaculia bacterium]